MKDYYKEVEGKGVRVVLCEADERVLAAARILKNKGYCDPVLVGSPEAYRSLEERLHISIEDIEMIAVNNYMQAMILLDIYTGLKMAHLMMVH